jgi:hypothetical protein
MSKFSPGPWRYTEDGGQGYVRDATDETVFTCDDLGAYARRKSDARLIAAAPEMYELLASLARTTLNPDTWVERVRTLLARIDGDSNE